MSDYRIPILISPRLNKVSTSKMDLLRRFNLYGSSLNTQSQGEVRNFVIFGNIKFSNQNLNLEFIDYHYFGNNLFAQAISIISHLRSNPKKRFCLIAGDLWFGGVLTLFLKIFFPKRLTLQISIHGLPHFSRNPVIAVIKSHLFQILLSQANSVRVVSKFLVGYLYSVSSVSLSKIFVSPIPIEIPKCESAFPRYIDIAVIGRLHNERGIKEAMRISESVSDFSTEKAISIQFIGDGPLKPSLIDWRESLQFPDHITIRGNLTSSEVFETLANTKILLSCAPSEGYGLSLREAIISGTYVVARNNPGTLELQKFFPEAIFLYEDASEAQKLVLDILESKMKDFDPSDFRKRQEEYDQESLKLLVDSWIY